MNAKKASKKTTKKTSTRKRRTSTPARQDIGGQLEQAFLAGLGALSNAKDVGNKAFDSLVDQGISFRKKTTKKTEALIDNVQDAIRDMTDDAQSRATGLMGQMRETPQLAKLQSVFDARVADALDRIGVASKHDVDDINKKLDAVLATLAAKKKAKKAAKKSSKKASKKKVAKKTTSRKTTSKKKAAPKKKASTKKATAKKAARKPAARKSAAEKPAAKPDSKPAAQATSSSSKAD